MHAGTCAALWGVSKKDLQLLRVDLIRAVCLRDIARTSVDPFDLMHLDIGPNAYTVTEQFIQPITAAAGNMSWALLLHPEGLNCDLFITHAWQEGLFEFIDKVVHSWPRAGNAAYVCFLAN